MSSEETDSDVMREVGEVKSYRGNGGVETPAMVNETTLSEENSGTATVVAQMDPDHGRVGVTTKVADEILYTGALAWLTPNQARLVAKYLLDAAEEAEEAAGERPVLPDGTFKSGNYFRSKSTREDDSLAGTNETRVDVE